MTTSKPCSASAPISRRLFISTTFRKLHGLLNDKMPIYSRRQKRGAPRYLCRGKRLSIVYIGIFCACDATTHPSRGLRRSATQQGRTWSSRLLSGALGDRVLPLHAACAERPPYRRGGEKVRGRIPCFFSYSYAVSLLSRSAKAFSIAST